MHTGLPNDSFILLNIPPESPPHKSLLAQILPGGGEGVMGGRGLSQSALQHGQSNKRGEGMVELSICE